MTNKFLSLILLTGVSTFSFAQETTSLTKNKEISVVAGMQATKINNSSLKQDENVTIDNGNGYNFSFEFSKYIKNRIGFGFGVGLSSYNQKYYEKGLLQLVNQTDKDGMAYDKWISSDLEHTNKLMYANIPINIHLLLGNSSRFYGFIDAGIVNQFLVQGTYSKEGSVETMARYSTDNPYFFILTQNNSYYDMKFTAVSKKDTERYKFYNMSFHLSAGIAAAMTDKLFLKVQPFLNFGNSDISGANLKGKEYENAFGEKSEYKPTKLFAAGINVGFAFNLD
ncbi:MAG: hypothetical protein K0Q95_662 [Bacteroidota bacterium]|nr:hypothetical protein [Bacteroidota bacterium]